MCHLLLLPPLESHCHMTILVAMHAVSEVGSTLMSDTYIYWPWLFTHNSPSWAFARFLCLTGWRLLDKLVNILGLPCPACIISPPSPPWYLEVIYSTRPYLSVENATRVQNLNISDIEHSSPLSSRSQWQSISRFDDSRSPTLLFVICWTKLWQSLAVSDENTQFRENWQSAQFLLKLNNHIFDDMNVWLLKLTFKGWDRQWAAACSGPD